MKFLLTFLLSALFASAAPGYTLTGSKWGQREIPIVISLGDDWNSAVAPVVGLWNIRAIRFVPEYRQVAQAARDGISSVTWANTYTDGSPFPSNVLAVAYHFADDGVIVESDILFNANQSFGAYSGPRQQYPYDIRRILVHEMGHSLGLGHSTDRSAIMYPDTGNPEVPTRDDFDGQDALYEPITPSPTPCPSPTPSNIVPRNAIGNMSTRGYVGEGDNVMIAGIILNSDRQVVIRALAPSLAGLVRQPLLADPKLTIYDANGSQIAYNDDWALPLPAELIPKDRRESALQLSLPAGTYTAVVSGGTGVGLVEVYDIGPR